MTTTVMRAHRVRSAHLGSMQRWVLSAHALAVLLVASVRVPAARAFCHARAARLVSLQHWDHLAATSARLAVQMRTRIQRLRVQRVRLAGMLAVERRSVSSALRVRWTKMGTQQLRATTALWALPGRHRRRTRSPHASPVLLVVPIWTQTAPPTARTAPSVTMQQSAHPHAPPAPTLGSSMTIVTRLLRAATQTSACRRVVLDLRTMTVMSSHRAWHVPMARMQLEECSRSLDA